MNETAETKKPNEHAAEENKGPLIHRVCISCNNMFVVPLDHIDEKHCSNCKKE